MSLSLGPLSEVTTSLLNFAQFFNIGKPSFSKWEEVESTLKLGLNPEEFEYVEAKVLHTQASRSREVSK